MLSEDAAYAAAAERQAQLTKPPGSLGRLEAVALQLARLQRIALPSARPAAALIFAADHPVAARGVSPYPQTVTRAMLQNFASGGAAAAVMAATHRVPLQVVDVGVVGTTGPYRVADEHTGDISVADGLDEAGFAAAWQSGERAVQDFAADARVIVLGEIGIANSTVAAALGGALLGVEAKAIVGPGTGATGEVLERKLAAVQRALDRVGAGRSPLELLRRLGGRELVAIAGAVSAASKAGKLVLVDGFIVTAAVLAVARSEDVGKSLLAAHRSGERGHRMLLEALGLEPLLDLQLRLGEATGALAAFPLVELAAAVHAGMATFAEAGVPDAD